MKHAVRKDPRNIKRARNIRQTLGTWVAARFLYKRGWSIEATRYILLGK